MNERQRELSGETARGIGWSVLTAGGGRLVSVVTLVVLARLLAPEDFGLLAFALVFLGYLETVGDLGTGMALIYWPDRWRSVAQLTFVVNLGMGLLWTALAWSLAPLVAGFFGNPEGEAILRALSWSLLIRGVGNTHDALLQRDLRFRARLFPELGLMVCKAVVAIPLAFLGFGVWSLVWGQLVGQTAWTLLLWVLVPWRPGWSVPLGSLGPVLRYGRGIVAVNMIAAVVHHADVVIVGRMFGATVLGFYQIAGRLPDMTITLLVRVTSKVLFPAFSRLHAEGAALGDVYGRALRHLALLTLPAAVGLVLLAEPLVVTLFGRQWLPSVPLLQVLAIYSGVRALGSYAGDILKATGRPSLLAGLGAARAVVLVPAMLLAGSRGVLGVALALAGVSVVSTAVNLAIGARLAGLSLASVLRALGPGAGAAVVLGALLGAWVRLADPLGPALELAGGTSIGLAVGVGALWLESPEALRRLAGRLAVLGRGAVGRPDAAAEAGGR